MPSAWYCGDGALFPAIPLMMKKSGGSLAYMSAFMVIAYVGTVLLMPFMVPWLVTGFTADPLTIAKPLVLFHRDTDGDRHSHS